MENNFKVKNNHSEKSSEVGIPAPQNSAEFSINAKGLWSFSCKTYGRTTEEAYYESLRLAEKAEKIIKEKNRI